MKNKPTNTLGTAINVLNEAVFIYNHKMEIKYFNSAAEKITGYPKAEVIGMKCVSLFDKNLCLNNCALCMTPQRDETRQKVSFQSPFLRKDGVERIGEFNAGLLWKKPGGEFEMLVAITDVTEITHLKNELRQSHSFRNIIGKSAVMADVFRTIRNIASFDSTVFIQGESGSGKELVAQAIHYESPRSKHNLVKVNCSAFSDNLLESELFGHVRGAFTGAEKDRIGRFEEADGGTIFLDEIGDMSATVQVKLLRVLQEKAIERVGENKTRKVDIRIIVASHKDIRQEVEEGRFRKDLYYRLNVIPLHLPPLRERKEDIPYLTRHFISKWNSKNHKPIAKISDPALERLTAHDWPGNVRELENIIEYACVKCAQDIIGPEDLPLYSENHLEVKKEKKRRNAVTRDMVLNVLTQCNNNRAEAAQTLNLHRITLWRKMRQWNIDA